MLPDKTISFKRIQKKQKTKNKKKHTHTKKKQQELPPFDKFISEVLIFAVANTFFQLHLVFIADSHTCFCFGFL